jgi:hypothetical protein
MPPVSKLAPGSYLSRRAERLVGMVLFQMRRVSIRQAKPLDMGSRNSKYFRESLRDDVLNRTSRPIGDV